MKMRVATVLIAFLLASSPVQSQDDRAPYATHFRSLEQLASNFVKALPATYPDVQRVFSIGVGLQIPMAIHLRSVTSLSGSQWRVDDYDIDPFKSGGVRVLTESRTYDNGYPPEGVSADDLLEILAAFSLAIDSLDDKSGWKQRRTHLELSYDPSDSSVEVRTGGHHGGPWFRYKKFNGAWVQVGKGNWIT